MKVIVRTDKAPSAIGPYNQAVKAGNLIYTSGNIPLNLSGEIIGKTIEEQTKQVMENLKALLHAASADLNSVVKTTCFLSDMNNFQKFNQIYGEYFEAETAPARSTVEVSRLPKDVLIEVEAVAILNES